MERNGQFFDGELKYSKRSVLKTNDTIEFEIYKKDIILVCLAPINDNKGLVNFDFRIL